MKHREREQQQLFHNLHPACAHGKKGREQIPPVLVQGNFKANEGKKASLPSEGKRRKIRPYSVSSGKERGMKRKSTTKVPTPSMYFHVYHRECRRKKGGKKKEKGDVPYNG